MQGLLLARLPAWVNPRVLVLIAVLAAVAGIAVAIVAILHGVPIHDAMSYSIKGRAEAMSYSGNGG